MRSNGNNYTCVAFNGGKFNKSMCGLVASYKLPNVSIPTHCQRHHKCIIGAIRETETPQCCTQGCAQTHPKYGIKGALPTICGGCLSSILTTDNADRFVDATLQCRILHCKNLATHGATSIDLEPWLCPEHAQRTKFACSAIYKSKCLHCDNHAAYIANGISTTNPNTTDSHIYVCGGHIDELMKISNMKFTAVNVCQMKYCGNAVYHDPSNDNTDTMRRHGLCQLHCNDSVPATKCVIMTCKKDAKCIIQGRNLCGDHLSMTCGIPHEVDQNTQLTAPDVRQPINSFAQLGKLPRTMDKSQERSLIDTLMYASSPAGSRSAGTGATRKRTISEMESIPSTPVPVPTPVPIVQNDVQYVNNHQDTSYDQLEFPPITMDDIAMAENLSLEESSYSSNYSPDYMYPGFDDAIIDNVYQQITNPLAQFETPQYEPTTYAPTHIITSNDIIEQVIRENNLEFVYHSANKCYYINHASIPMLILTDATIKRIDRPAKCVLVRLHGGVSFDIMRALFYSIMQTLQSPFAPKFCQYEI